MTRPSRKTKRNTDPTMTVAREIDLPQAQRIKGDIVLTDVVNFTDADQRHMTRQGKRQTVRKLTRIERLVKMGIIDRDQAHACQWYADAHELGFVASLGVTANYEGAGGGGCTSFDLLSRHKAQKEARDNYAFGKAAIPPELVALFEDVVLGSMGENEFRAATRNEVLRIGIAAWRLHGQVSHLITVVA